MRPQCNDPQQLYFIHTYIDMFAIYTLCYPLWQEKEKQPFRYSPAMISSSACIARVTERLLSPSNVVRGGSLRGTIPPLVVLVYGFRQQVSHGKVARRGTPLAGLAQHDKTAP